MPGELGNCLAGPGREPVQPARAQLHRATRPARRRWRRWTPRSRAWSSAQFDAAVTGGVDRNMGVTSFIKFCAIGALSGTGTRPYADGADGFVMGEGAGAVPAQAPRRRRARRRPHLRGRARHGRRERRQGQGPHGAQPDRPEARDRARLAQRRALAGGVLADRRPRHLDRRSATPSSSSSLGDGVRRRRPRARIDRARLGEVEHRPPEGRGRARPGCSRRRSRCTTRSCRRASASRARTRASTGRPSPFAVNTELRDWELPNGGHARGRRERVRLRRDELPRRARGVRARPAGQRQRPGDDRGASGRAGGGLRGGDPGRRRPRPRSGGVRRPGCAGQSPSRGALLVGAADADGLAARLRAIVESGDAPPPAPPAAEDLAARRADLHRLRRRRASWRPRPSRR